jgi:aryl-alcohol dehydrogenase-like predicted oxidoreductase
VEYRELGNTGIEVSAVGMGGNVFGPPRQDLASSRRTVDAALDAGVNFFDTAHLYNGGESERFLGEILGGRRARVVVATKFHLNELQPGESAAARVRRQCEESLARLRTDYVDLLQIHFLTPGFPLEEVLATLGVLVREGKVRHVGECNFAAWRHRDALCAAERLGAPPLATAQNQYNLLRRLPEAELLPMCRALGIGFLPYFPLAGGFLTGKYRPGAQPPPGTRGAAGSPVVRRMREPRAEAVLANLEAFAAAHGRSVGALAIAWLLAHPEVSSVIAGAMNPEQVLANVAAGAWRLSDAERAEVDGLCRVEGLDQAIEPDLSSFR